MYDLFPLMKLETDMMLSITLVHNIKTDIII